MENLKKGNYNVYEHASTENNPSAIQGAEGVFSNSVHSQQLPSSFQQARPAHNVNDSEDGETFLEPFVASKHLFDVFEAMNNSKTTFQRLPCFRNITGVPEKYSESRVSLVAQTELSTIPMLPANMQQVSDQVPRICPQFKTMLCFHYLNGNCSFGSRCKFAHGVDELRCRIRHPKYKTRVCVNFINVGWCKYGDRCVFIHPTEVLHNNLTSLRRLD
ncbi:mRNA decay activator protein ZFP36-like [Argiope bruennichi]|uniref:mRNA decay activator protein ZFP36L1 like protein n=1 Tax=Argiope bruennichi TaxID=94029 RepID=A0A8T0F2G8_ARGBR|nr:mRNA decay activator protein ZFP36-like [Argiope bruennichi]XP_055927810.1 mRNA decay activator protein ZFP36-like [Argiope bruennichi]XP_055927812.1 mRNA decay activator protein ZFP36-like [Argiope bruennichi]KAF8784662.1 mRNA decay activator protein ZFP36L1 like protein [Argiope bruennichi]